ncbi:hypothetical protein ACFT38_42830 [Streptomyces sp. NPDC056975]|uniref:hypothetical protein n=1 Tax=Streptomyces sp. NPDC056975 TaxID=3345985 RepID=UPI00363594BA
MNIEEMTRRSTVPRLAPCEAAVVIACAALVCAMVIAGKPEADALGVVAAGAAVGSIVIGATRTKPLRRLAELVSGSPTS